ncbi:hypothetical protein [Lacticaseibacillus hulanensis]|uniref:hypothetical protein n=1 Tax=Lacticaseibacillus hulanensis TaxID=2493111 RepID=UPI000FDABCEA|nr:hypothetical protein [Lacticaseibacillus hulanensis]
MSIIKHAMLFNYFQQAGQGNEAYRDELEHSDDMIQTITHLANQEQVTVPYLMPLTLIGDNVSATLATALDVEEEDVTFYPFVVAEPRSFSRRRLNIHVFALMADNRMFCHSFDPVFELRVQNHAGE